MVEKWVPTVNIRRDLFGFADVLAVHPSERRFLLVQTTTAAHLANRLAKVQSRPESATWLAAGGEIEVHGWVQRNGRWHCRRVGVTPDMVPTVLASPPKQRRRSRWQQPVLFI